MAKILIAVGPLTSEIAITDAKATAILDRYFQALARQHGTVLSFTGGVVEPLPTTPKGKLDYVLKYIVRNIVETAKAELANSKFEVARTEAEEEGKELEPNGTITAAKS